jgi:hypothetical protein
MLKDTQRDELTKGQRICYERGYHNDEEFIDPQSGGFVMCMTCRRQIDCEESDG